MASAFYFNNLPLRQFYSCIKKEAGAFSSRLQQIELRKF
jgi:hypothetical protein